MADHSEDFVRGVALVLQGESLKAGCYVRHGQSLGVLREKIVATLIRNETPERYRVETGIISDYESPRKEAANQIDLLVHDANEHPPLYRWEDFVVVKMVAARAIVEVKSDLQKTQFDELMKLHFSYRKLDRSHGMLPLFGYALKGFSFGKFLEHLSAVIRENPVVNPSMARQGFWTTPTCIVVQQRNYISVTPNAVDRGHDWNCCAVNFAGSAYADGVETGTFLRFYSQLMETPNAGLTASAVARWYNQMDVPEKAYIGRDGEIHHGNILVG